MFKPFQSTRNFTVNTDVEETGRLFERSLRAIGTVSSTEPSNDKLIIKGKSRYGLQGVNMEIAIENAEGLTMVNIIAKSDDARAIGAKKCIDRLLETQDNFREGAGKDSYYMRMGISRQSLFLGVVVVLVVVCGVVFFVMRN